MISTHSLKILSVARKKDLKNHRKRIPENNHAIVNEEISSEENLENQDLSMKTKMDSGDVYGRGDIIVYNDQPRRREDLKNQRKMISENKHDIDEEISSAENLENDRGDILLYDNRVQRRELGQRLLNRWTSQLDLGCTTGRLERVVSVHNST